LGALQVLKGQRQANTTVVAYARDVLNKRSRCLTSRNPAETGITPSITT
jgi:hypothetical protein